MEKMYRINKTPYGEINAIKMSVDYDKNQGGYIIKAEFVELWDNGLYGKLFSREYYAHNGDGVVLIIPCGRRSEKKKQEAEKIFLETSRKYAVRFLENVNTLLGINVALTEDF